MIITRQALITLALTILTGCGSLNLDELDVDAACPAGRIEAIAAANTQWCDAGAPCLPLRVVDTGANVVCDIPAADEPGRGLFRRGKIWIFPSSPDADVQNVARHEVGHVISRQRGHIEERGHTMSAGGVEVDEITETDLNWVMWGHEKR